MFHISCDLCGKEIHPGPDARYVVKIEVQAAHDPLEITEADLEEDHLEAVSQLLRDLEDGAVEEDLAPIRKQFRYDLCPRCQKKYLNDPLGKQGEHKFNFSEN